MGYKNRSDCLFAGYGCLSACTRARGRPDNARIESVGLLALHGRQASAIDQLRVWAVAAGRWRSANWRWRWLRFERSAQAWRMRCRTAAINDTEAQFQLGQAFIKAGWGTRLTTAKPGTGMSEPPHQAMQSQFHAGAWRNMAKACRASQPLGQMAAGGGVQGNAQAMFLLSNAYAQVGVEQNQQLARDWLERSAEVIFGSDTGACHEPGGGDQHVSAIPCGHAI